MGTLQDQLLKAGLVSEQQLKESRSKRRRKKAGGAAKDRRPDEIDLARAYAERAREEQRERDRELNRRREEERRRKAANARLRQLVLPNALNEGAAELSRFFEHNGKIRKLFVTAGQQESLNAGALGIAYVQGRYYLVSADVLERVRVVRAEAVAFHVADIGSSDAESDDPAYDDPRFRIPDDLTW